MAIALQQIVYRSRRRVRLVFSNTLGAGAFSPAWFTFASTDDLGSTPAVMAALVVGDAPNVLELALGDDLADGAGYTCSAAIGIPAADASTTSVVTTLPLRAPAPAPATSDTNSTDAALDELYRVDLAFDGNDWVEGPDGDLGVERGVPNVESALARRMSSDGLQWREDYGAKPRQSVDAPSPSAAAFKADLIRQARADPRVRTALVTYSGVSNQADEHRFELEAQLVGNRVARTTSLLRTS